MPAILVAGVSLFSSLIGYLIGRAGHLFYGHLEFFDHWIYGIGLILVGFLADFDKIIISSLFVAFGLGLFISDFHDFKNLKFYGKDEHEMRKFWGFD